MDIFEVFIAPRAGSHFRAVGLKEDYISHNDNGQFLATKGLH